MRSKSVINYGTNTTINVNGNKLKKYLFFDIVNINYYDAILGILFLKKYEVIIDFV